VIGSPTIIYKDNVACVAQMKTRYIKTNYTKHISLKLFFPHQLQESGEISILQIKSCNNLTNLFTKSLPLIMFDKCVKALVYADLRFTRFRWENLSEWNLVIRHYNVLFFFEFFVKFLIKGF
jgi:hypothetical protein